MHLFDTRGLVREVLNNCVSKHIKNAAHVAASCAKVSRSFRGQNWPLVTPSPDENGGPAAFAKSSQP